MALPAVVDIGPGMGGRARSVFLLIASVALDVACSDSVPASPPIAFESTAAETGTGGSPGTGSAGTGATPEMVCTPGTTQACYSGPPGTEGVGICKAGTATCTTDGVTYGPCEGEVLPFAKNCATPTLDEACNGDPGPCVAPPLCANIYGDAAKQSGTAVAAAPGGDIVLSGTSGGSIDFGAGPIGPGMFLVRLDPTCHVVWQKAIPGAGSRSVAIDAGGNVIVYGTFHGSIDFGGTPLSSSEDALFLAKLDVDGQHVFSRAFFQSYVGDFADWVVAATPADEIVITGRLVGSLDVGGGPLVAAGGSDAFIAKLDALGNHIWSKRFGDANDQVATSVAVDGQGNIALVGGVDGTIDFGGGALVATASDLFVAEFDAAGNHLWSKILGGSGSQAAMGAAFDPNGNVIVVGISNSAVDLGGGVRTAPPAGLICFAGKLSPAGSHVWSSAFGCDVNPYVPMGPRVAASPTGDVVVTGTFDGATNFGLGNVTSDGSDAFALKLASSGAPIWLQTFSSTGYDEGLDVAIDEVGNVLLTGEVAGGTDFGGGLLPALGSLDAYFVKAVP